MAEENVFNGDCILHRISCTFFCQYSKCTARILCERCAREHSQNHPKEFIYHVDSLGELHALNRVDKLKENLVSDKIKQDKKGEEIFMRFAQIYKPYTMRIEQFEKESKGILQKELNLYLSKNKHIIEQIKVDKSVTNKIINNPTKMLNETTAEVELINKREVELTENSEYYYWYRDSTEEMIDGIYRQLESMNQVAIKLMNQCLTLQKGAFSKKKVMKDDDEENKLFYLKYINSHDAISHGDQNQLQITIIKLRKELQKRENENKRAHNEIKERNKKIEELLIKIDNLKEELVKWEEKADREERQRREAALRQRKQKVQTLIKNGIIGENERSISFYKKKVEDKLFPLILEEVPSPLQLDLSAHNLTRQQLNKFLVCSTVQKLKMNFTYCDDIFLAEAFKSFPELNEVELNSAEIDDEILAKLSRNFSKNIKKLQLMDNRITDDGLQKMFINFQSSFQSLFLSYNPLTSRTIDIIGKYSFYIQVLHIAKNPIKTKGCLSIGKYLKNLRELYIGGTGIQKQGFLALCRNCLKLKRLSLVSNELSPDVIFQILDGITGLEWLDVSYCGFNDEDWEKIDKLKMFNKNLELVHNF